MPEREACVRPCDACVVSMNLKLVSGDASTGGFGQNGLAKGVPLGFPVGDDGSTPRSQGDAPCASSPVMVQGVMRAGDRGQQALCFFLPRFRLLLDRPNARVPAEGYNFSCISPYPW
jgi:hypothetical protein